MRFEKVELSTIDTSLLLAGALFCQSYFADTAAGRSGRSAPTPTRCTGASSGRGRGTGRRR